MKSTKLKLYKEYKIFFDFDKIGISDELEEEDKQNENIAYKKIISNLPPLDLSKIRFDRISCIAFLYMIFVIMKNKNLVRYVFFSKESDFVYDYNISNFFKELEKLKKKIMYLIEFSDIEDETVNLFKLCNDFLNLVNNYIL